MSASTVRAFDAGPAYSNGMAGPPEGGAEPGRAKGYDMSGDRVFLRITAFIHRNPPVSEPAAQTAPTGPTEQVRRARQWQVVNRVQPQRARLSKVDMAGRPAKTAIVNSPAVALSRRWSATP